MIGKKLEFVSPDDVTTLEEQMSSVENLLKMNAILRK